VDGERRKNLVNREGRTGGEKRRAQRQPPHSSLA